MNRRHQTPAHWTTVTFDFQTGTETFTIEAAAVLAHAANLVNFDPSTRGATPEDRSGARVIIRQIKKGGSATFRQMLASRTEKGLATPIEASLLAALDA